MNFENCLKNTNDIKIANELNGSKAKKLKFLLRAILHKKDIIDLYNLFEKDSLKSIIKSQPEIYNKPFTKFCVRALN